MTVDDFKISEDIYRESLTLEDASLKISDDIFEESESLTSEIIQEKISDSYNMSDRYWIWRMGNYSYTHDWEYMYEAGEMQVEARGLKYLKSYQNMAALENDYKIAHPDNAGATSLPLAYWAFANYLRKGDVILACSNATRLFAWGVVNGPYKFSIIRKRGRHYRQVTWNKMEMPFIFTDKKPALFLIDKEETNHLKEALLNKVVFDAERLPFELLVKHM